MKPSSVPTDVPLRRLLAAYEQRAHHAAGAGAQDGAGRAGHALTCLALSAAMVARLAAMRWVHVEIALLAGAGLQAVADAQGLDVEEVRVGYSMALDQRVVDGRLDPASAAKLRALLDDGPR